MATLVLTGGGTAGHVLPNLALVRSADTALGRAVAEGRVRVAYVGSHDGLERSLVTTAEPDWPSVAISAGRLRRFLTLSNVLTPARVALGFVQARAALRRLEARALFSKGGFVAAPVVWAAWSLGIPVVIHESDMTPALTTKLTARCAERIFCAFEATQPLLAPKYRDRTEVVGIPLRPQVLAASREAAVERFGLDPDRPTVLVFGGSLGARVLNEAVRPVAAELGRRYNVIHLVGRGKAFAVEDGSHYRQFEYLTDDMPLALAAADLALCRAGASSIFELAARRVPMILVPLDLDQSRGDQIENAQYFRDRGWAEVVREAELTPAVVTARVAAALEALDERRPALATAPSTLAVERIGDVLLELLAR